MYNIIERTLSYLYPAFLGKESAPICLSKNIKDVDACVQPSARPLTDICHRPENQGCSNRAGAGVADESWV